MKNEKVNEVLDVIIKVISIVSILAQAIKSAFPVQQTVSADEQAQIEKFLKGE